MMTLLIAEDHPVFRKGLKDIVSEAPGYQVVGETGDGSAVLDLVRTRTPDVLLLDLNLPGCNGLEIARKIREENLSVHIIVLTMHNEEAMFNKAMDLGVHGYVLKESAVQDILDCIKTVAGGRYYISPTISQYLIRRESGARRLREHYPWLDQLTPTERKILRLISENKSSREIAGLLFISVRTVENHRQSICSKLNVHGSNGLLKFALENKSLL